MPKARLNRLSVHYQQVGQGPDLVMIHGLFANLAFWYLSVLPALAQNFRVTVYDLRGHGFSDMPRSGYRTYDLAEDLAALLDNLAIGQVHLVGHSYGGAVGLHFTALYPERVSSLTLADARVPYLQPILQSRTNLRRKLIAQHLRRKGVEIPDDFPLVLESYLEELTRLQPGKQRETRTDTWGPAMLLGGWNGNSRAVRRWFELVRTTSALQDLAKVDGLNANRLRRLHNPVLAIYGRRSNCLPTLRGLEQDLPNLKKVLIPGVGHFHPVIKPVLFTQNLQQFISDPGS